VDNIDAKSQRHVPRNTAFTGLVK